MKKKLVMMCLAGAMVLGMTACGSKSEETAATETEAAQETTAESDGETADAETSLAEESETEETKVSERSDYVALEDLEIDEYVTLADYKNMTVQADRTEMTDELIEDYINANLLTTYPVTDRAVEDGDLVTIDYVGKKDDVAFDGGSAEGYQLSIGSDTFIDGFEDGLIGVTPGETVDLNLTFPESYGNSDLAGQEVVFTVTVQNILESAEYADVTEEQLALMGLDYTTKEELWAAGEEELAAEIEESYQTTISSAVMEKLVSESEFIAIPQPLVDEEVQNYNEYLEAICMSFYGCDLETYITTYNGMTMDEYNSQMEEMATETVKQYLVMEAVARQEGIEITDDEINETAAEEAVTYGYDSAEALLDEVGETTYRMYMLQERVMDQLVSIVTVEPTTETETETETTTAAQ